MEKEMEALQRDLKFVEEAHEAGPVPSFAPRGGLDALSCGVEQSAKTRMVRSESEIIQTALNY
jgi:hypothetical protein